MTSKLNKAISSDLNSNIAKTMTKESKAQLKNFQKTINNQPVQIGANSVADYLIQITGGQAGEMEKSGSRSAQNTPKNCVERRGINNK